MAKKRVRGAVREPSRAELKALERRAAVAVPAAPRVRDEDVTASAAPDLAPSAPTGARRGVLPPRPTRLSSTPVLLSREQELAYIRQDLRRILWIALAMLVLFLPLAFILR